MLPDVPSTSAASHCGGGHFSQGTERPSSGPLWPVRQSGGAGQVAQGCGVGYRHTLADTSRLLGVFFACGSGRSGALTTCQPASRATSTNLGHNRPEPQPHQRTNGAAPAGG